MNQRRTTIIALACGVLCVLCVGVFMYDVAGRADAARAEALERYGGEQVDVCVAARDIAPGERVDASAVETRTWVSDLLPQGAVTDASEVVGKTATSSIYAGEVFCGKRFENDGAASLEVPDGTTAVSVPAKRSAAVGGALAPGMYVDVYASGDSSTTAIARDVLVLATSLDGSSSAQATAWVTLAVSPSSVQEIISASAKTDLTFTLPAGNNKGNS